MTFWYRHRKIISLVTIIVLFIGGLIFFYISKNYKKTKTSKEKEVVVEKKIEKKVEKKEEKTKYKVDIKGEVNNPGIYSLDEDSRVIDVINMAEGLTENADTTVINLSKKIKDEMVIIIYSKEEVENFKDTKEKEKIVESKCITPENTDLKNDACIIHDEISENNTEKININTASLEELKKLPGIGEGKAKNIISYREKSKFNSIEEIKNVEGIGDSLYAQIEANITV